MRALNIVVFDVRKVCDFTDYMVVCTGESRRQLHAVESRISEQVAATAGYRTRVEGGLDGGWILVDAIDVVVHLFDPEAREFYDLELLWGGAPKIKWQKTPSAKS